MIDACTLGSSSCQTATSVFRYVLLGHSSKQLIPSAPFNLISIACCGLLVPGNCEGGKKSSVVSTDGQTHCSLPRGSSLDYFVTFSATPTLLSSSIQNFRLASKHHVPGDGLLTSKWNPRFPIGWMKFQLSSLAFLWQVVRIRMNQLRTGSWILLNF